MNEVLLKGAIKMIKNFISPDQLKGIAENLIKQAIDYKNTIALDPENGETQIGAVFFELNGTVYFSVIIFDNQDRIVRQEFTQPISKLIDELLNKL